MAPTVKTISRMKRKGLHMYTYLKRVVHDIKQFKILLGQVWKLNSIIGWYDRNCYLSIKKWYDYRRQVDALIKQNEEQERRLDEITNVIDKLLNK